MKIVIIGNGKVGLKLATQLSEEDYDVILIDKDEEKLKYASNSLDIFCIAGDGADVDVLRQADAGNADLVIACTSEDELNMLCCLLAKHIGAKNTIARVRNPVYYKQIHHLKADLRLSMAVNPEKIVSNEISRVLLFPDTNKVEKFVKGKVELVQFQLKENSILDGVSLAELYQKFQIKILVCAVKRDQEVYIPGGDFVLRSDDKIYVTASHSELERLFNAIGKRSHKIHNVLICGGGRVSFYLAQELISAGMQVKIIELDLQKCENLCEQLPKATIIRGDATDHELLLEEGIENADALVALTGMDEENIIMSLYAKMKGVSKVVAKINEDSRVQMVERLGIESIVSAKSVTADAILSYVRARKNSAENENVETMYKFVNGRVEAAEFLIRKESKYTNVPLKDLRIKKNNLIACIVRKGKIIIPGGNDHMEIGDSVIVVTMEHALNALKDILL